MRILAASIVALALTACDQPAPPPPAPAPETPASTEPDYMSEPAEPSGSESFLDSDPTPLTREELIGTWSVAAFCGQPYVFSADGAVRDPGNNVGTWRLTDDRLVMTINGRVIDQTVNPLNETAFASGPGDGLVAIYRKCSSE